MDLLFIMGLTFILLWVFPKQPSESHSGSVLGSLLLVMIVYSIIKLVPLGIMSDWEFPVPRDSPAQFYSAVIALLGTLTLLALFKLRRMRLI